MILVGAGLACAACSHGSERQAKPQAAREQQWLFRETLGSGDVEPTAVFLSWDYSSVVFTARCDRRTKELVLRSELESGPHAPDVKPLEISSDASTVRMRTSVVEGYFEGRSQVTKELASIMRSSGDLEVFVPTEMGEPLYVGRAEPLRRVSLMCRVA